MRENGALLANSVADDATGANGTKTAPASQQDVALEQPTRDPRGGKCAENDEVEPAATLPTESANEDSHPEDQAHNDNGCDDQNGTLEACGTDKSLSNPVLNGISQASSRNAFPDAVATLREMVGNLDSILKLSLATSQPMNLVRTSCSLVKSIHDEIKVLLSNSDDVSADDSEISTSSRNVRRVVLARRRSMSEWAESAATSVYNPDKVDAEDSLPDLDSPIGLDGPPKLGGMQQLKVMHVSAKTFASLPGPHRNIHGITSPDIIAIYDDEGPELESSLRLLPTEYPRPRSGADHKPRSKLPAALQIKTPALLAALNSILEIDLEKYNDSTILAPFGAIVLRWPQMLAMIKQARDDANGIEANLRNQAVLAEPSNNDDRKANTTSRDALKYELGHKIYTHLLLNGTAYLLRDLIGPTLEVREKLDNSTLATITFEELWQLFPVGETLIHQRDGREVACQVYKTVGGSRGRAVRDAKLAEDLFSAPEDIANHTKAEESRPRDRGIPQYPASLIHHLASSYQALSSSESHGSDTREAFHPLILDCFMMDFNGTYVGPCHISFQFDFFPGKQPIRALDAYPLRFHRDKNGLAARLRERGRRLIDAAGHRSHDGFPLSGLDNIRGQIYIDNATGYRHIGWPKERIAFGRMIQHWMSYETIQGLTKNHPLVRENIEYMQSQRLVQKLKRTLWRFVRPNTTTLSKDCYLLMSYAVLGYHFQMRRWYYFDIDRVGNIDKSEVARLSGWKDLVIPTHFREMLVALVDSHASGSSRAATRRSGLGLTNQIDLVRGKGNGLIILLHGPPGSGKTSTAETIAAYTKRPLYSITCGDIGTTAEEVEFNLQKHFDLANQWGCVLCLDEADVFLMKRDWHDLNRNSLVSVWLRVLEYYSGILFITTNRIGVIDEAFKSRIHICLRYPSLDLASTTLIWTKILDRIERENKVESVQIKFDRDAVMTFAQKHYQRNEVSRSTWNGRQIRNVVQTAISLGHYERLKRLRDKGMTEEDAERAGKSKYMYVELTKDNLRRIATTATDFEQYIVNVRGSDVNSARNESVRDDDYDGSGKRPQKQYDMLEVARVGAMAALGTPGKGSGFIDLEAGVMESKCGYGQGNGKGSKSAILGDSDSSS